MIALRILLLPFTALYALIIFLRTQCYKSGILPRTSFDLPVICVGNLSAGGTGKTPHIEWLIAHLQNSYRLAVLSRGYKRKTSGYQFADVHSTPETIGDEPFQIYQKFRNVAVGVSANRVLGVPDLLGDAPDTEVILMDDGYQHLPLKASAYLLLTDFNNLYTDDWLIPSGLLREFRSGAERADLIIVTKCPPDLSTEARQRVTEKINPTAKQQVYFSYLEYGNPISVWDLNEMQLSPSTTVIGFSGIARSAAFESHLKSSFNSVNFFQFSDHHDYRTDDEEKIVRSFSFIETEQKAILCTEKDAVKLRQSAAPDVLRKLPVYFIPVKVNFMENGADEVLAFVHRLVKIHEGSQ